MQAAHQTQADQHAFVATESEPQAANQSGAPTPISPELLHFVGGGKGVAQPTIDVSLPVGKW